MSLSLISMAPTALNFGGFATPKAKAAPVGFAYGLPGTVGPAGEFDPANFLKGKSQLEVFRYREVRAHAHRARAAFATTRTQRRSALVSPPHALASALTHGLVPPHVCIALSGCVCWFDIAG
jgi:hypothetical protein